MQKSSTVSGIVLSEWVDIGEEESTLWGRCEKGDTLTSGIKYTAVAVHRLSLSSCSSPIQLATGALLPYFAVTHSIDGEE
jgi:hypothetical protein